MSFVIVAPEMVATAATDLAGTGSALSTDGGQPADRFDASPGMATVQHLRVGYRDGDGAPRSLPHPMSGRPLHHTTGNPDQRLAVPAEQFDRGATSTA